MNIDDDILQDFLIEAGELFEMLGEQIVELEQNPEDSELLNAIFRAFHTIKGGAGFLKITPMVETCHRAEDVFNVLRQGERIADANLIDVILQVIDVLGDMFDLLRGGEELPDADPQLLRSLEKLLSENAGAEAESEPAAVVAETEAASVEPATVEQNSSEPAGGEAADMDTEFEAMLQAAQQPEPADEKKDDDIISDDEFENLLDELHGAGKHSGVPVAADAAGEKPSPAGSDELITDDEFENLLDELHGAGKHGGVPGGESAAAEATVAATTEKAGSDDLISDDEFEAVLDDMYGKNRGPGSASEGKAKNTGAAEPVKSPAQDAASPPVPDAVSDAAAAEPAGTRAVSDTPISPPPVSTPPASSVGVDRTAGAAKKTPAKRKAAGAQAETSVRVDTSRLDDIMNLVGELVLVRNRLSTLKQIVREGQVLDAISNLELVTSDLQASVMKTRMQPIKKVFNRFPRVIRDLARQLNKDIELVLVGEDTDLDKNLVEALADPLVHLVRNAVDHGIESPEERFANGKPRQGTVTLSAVQEGDQILLTISDDGKGMDHEMLRRKAVEKELMSEEAANRLTETEAYNLI
ncbi:MAG TPA: chemotaxis protein CheA, partial [Thiotrichales bacterium]|nr:chemotaxis protein CheA [Thiotrichales bacterium]